MKQKINGCNNCKYFRAHYSDINLRCQVVNCGHCIKRNITKKDYMRFPFITGCEEWESNTSEIHKKKEDAEYQIAEIQKQLINLVNIFAKIDKE